MNVTFANFRNYPELSYGFSTRADGSMHRHHEKINRDRYFSQHSIASQRVVTADLIHGTRVARVDSKDGGQLIPDTDGLLTNEQDVFITVTGADCFPIYFYDPECHAVGITHAGWRGVVGNIVKNVVQEMVKEFDSRPPQLIIGIGPGIRQCHFDIKVENEIFYKNVPEAIRNKGGRTYIDLPLIIKRQLMDVGVYAEHIEDSMLCTYCNTDDYFSFRRDKPKVVEPQVAYIGMR